MPQSRIEIEEIGPGRWVAEVEAGGGSSARRQRVTGATFDDIVLAVIETHGNLTQATPSVRPVKEVLADQAARDADAKAAAETAEAAAADAATAAELADQAAFAQAHAAEDTERLVGEAEERTRQNDADVPVASMQRDTLIAQAEALGLSIDRRWGDARLRYVVEAEHARRAASA